MKLNWCKVKEENALRHIEFVDVTATNRRQNRYGLLQETKSSV